MATLIAKYSDYVINSIEFFITKIKNDIALRDLPGLTNNKIDSVNVQKQHPLVTLMSAKINDQGRNFDHLRSSIIPAISVTPGNMSEEGFTLGQTYKTEVVDNDFIDILKEYQEKTDKEIQEDVLITQKQIETIISAYNRTSAGGMRVQRNEWSKNEEINISVWSDTPDIDKIFGDLIDSTLASIRVGLVGDNSAIRYLRYSINKGLVNFNYGRTLFGTEYNLTFFNTYSNYNIFTDDVVSGHDFYGTFTTPGEGEEWDAE
jgi:hypothetical protein